MDIGSLVVDLVSLVIVTSVLALVIFRKDTRSPVEQRSASYDDEDASYFGPNPSESPAEDGARGH